MQKLNCFVIVPSNRNGNPIQLTQDDKWGLVELPSECQAQSKSVFELDFDQVYELIIKDAIKQVNSEYKAKQIRIDCTRGQDLRVPGGIINQLIQQICSADITITDITAQNPNVFLEYGIRLSVQDALNIMICHKHNRTELPFDVRGLRCIYYSMDVGGANQAKNTIVNFIREYLENRLIGSTGRAETGPTYKDLVELHTRRGLERGLLEELEKAPRLVADIVEFLLLLNQESPDLEINLRLKLEQLKIESFTFLESVGNTLRRDSTSQRRAIKHYKFISNMKDIKSIEFDDWSLGRLLNAYYELAKLCAKDPDLKKEAEGYRNKAKELEEGL